MHKRPIWLVLAVLVFSGSLAHAGEAPAMQWHKGHGTDNGGHVHYGLQTGDGGYVIFTDSDTAGAMGENNFGLMKIAPDHAGDWLAATGQIVLDTRTTLL